MLIFSITFGLIWMAKSGNTLICFSCSSDSREKCEDLQTATVCQPTELACLTLSYDSYIHNTDTGLAQVTAGSVFKKKCVSGNVDCQMYCRSLASIGKYNCLSRCCQTEFCNHEERLVTTSRAESYSMASKDATKSYIAYVILCAIIDILLCNFMYNI